MSNGVIITAIICITLVLISLINSKNRKDDNNGK